MPHIAILFIIFIIAAGASSNAGKQQDNAKKKEYIEKTYQINVLHPINKEPWVIEHETKVINKK